MLIKRLSEFGVKSDMAYVAALASIFASIIIWVTRRGEDTAHAERFGIFVGLWAPTFAILAQSLEEQEKTLSLSLE